MPAPAQWRAPQPQRRSKRDFCLAFSLCMLVVFPYACDDEGGSFHGICKSASVRPNGLVIAGSGTNLAPLQIVVERFRGDNPDAEVFVGRSIGTGGAIKALLEGAIDIGLASRDLNKSERRLGLRQIPLLRVPLAVVARSVPEQEVSLSRLAQIYRGEITTWSDGSPITLLVRQSGDSAMRALTHLGADFSRALAEARSSKRALICYTDQEMRDALLSIRGAVGFLDMGTLHLEKLPLQVLRVPRSTKDVAGDQRTAPVEHLTEIKLSLVTRETADDFVRHFVAFAQTYEATEGLDQAGYTLDVKPQLSQDK